MRYYCTDVAGALSGTDRHGALTVKVREALHEVPFKAHVRRTEGALFGLFPEFDV